MEFTLLIGVATIVCLWLWYRRQTFKGLPPGPFYWPLLGNIPQVMLHGKKPLFQIGLDWRKKYGDVFLMNMGAVRIVWVCGLELGREVLLQRGEDFDYRAKWMTMARETQRNHGLVYNHGAIFRQLKRILEKATLKEGVGDKPLETRYMEEVSMCVKEMDKIAGAGKEVQLDLMLKTCFVNLMYGIVFGKRLEYGDENLTSWVALLGEIKDLNQTILLEDMFPCLHIIPSAKTSPLLQKKLVAARQLIHDAISEHEKVFSPRNPSDVIDLCIESMKRGTDISVLNICNLVLDCFFADTNGEKFLWMIAFIVGHQDVQAKCRAEINKVIGKKRFVTSDDMTSLPYTYATMSETLRYGGTQLSIPHGTVRDTFIAGYRIPKHSVVIVILASIHLDPDLYENPLEFRPERFIDENGKRKKMDHFYPYGMGNRKCTSWEAADRALFLFFANLIQKFEFVTPEGHEPVDLRGLQKAPHIPFRPKPFYVKVNKCMS